MTDHSKDMARVSLGGVINALAAVSAHIPCCGSQLFIGIFGAQTLGAISTSYLYKFQFFMPILVSALLAGLLIAWGCWHRRRHLFCDHVKAHQALPTNIQSFFILNLVVGYVVVGLLYFFVPPHKHHIVDTHVNGYLTADQQTIFALYHDEKRSWPWSKRIFVAKADKTPSPAQELFWYDFKSHETIKNLSPAPVHLYARPAGTWVAGGAQTPRPLQFYIATENPRDYLLSQIKNDPALVIFYRSDCAPCHVEINMLPELKHAAEHIHITVISLTSPDKVLAEKLKGLDIQLVDASDRDTSALLRAFNDQQLALPFSFMLDKEGTVCARRAGLLGLNIIKDWRKQCLQ
jgi:thiol-disulfide isomerase/thioredoxin